jgi:hypothetical protein
MPATGIVVQGSHPMPSHTVNETRTDITKPEVLDRDCRGTRRCCLVSAQKGETRHHGWH